MLSSVRARQFPRLPRLHNPAIRRQLLTTSQVHSAYCQRKVFNFRGRRFASHWGKGDSVLKLLERTISSLDERLILLAPTARVPGFFENVEQDAVGHRRLVREMQRLRGKIYLKDGALDRTQLTLDGLHETAEDNKSWHLLMVDSRRRVTGCAWYLEHSSSVGVDDLRVRHTPLARSAEWRGKLWKGVQSELKRARREQLRYAEVGGWAVSEKSRCTSEGLVLALAGYSLGRICGGCLGITTATVRHCSSSILRRLGGAPLAADGAPVPSYFDPRYGCEMEILRFDSRRPNPKFNSLIERLRERMASVPILAPAAVQVQPAFYGEAAALAS
jgi:hypothetical protein